MTESWLIAYDVTALIGIGSALYVMQKTEHDRINKVAPDWLQWSRRGSFITMVLLLCNSIISDASWISLVLIVWSGIMALLINGVALALRVPPGNRPRSHVNLSGAFQKWNAVREMFVSFRNDVRK